ncbi:MAG: restriction endonuclease [Saprospiraceae bacterium]|nr:restriction endonuclease [Saprospiraceae bacterium]
MNTFQVTKASGQTEAFDEEKLRRSLRHSGAQESLINQILQEMEGQWQEGMSTKTIYKRAFKLLKRLHRPTAARYTLKQAMLDFGNSGFPFEDFVSEILKSKGYEVKTRQLLQGACVQHEVDVVAEGPNELIWVECKYHPMAGSVSNVKIPLYIHSRFRDLEKKRSQTSDLQSVHAWIVTNTRFSDDAMRYGRCAGLELIGWNYPSGKSLRELVESAGLHPLTCLTTLTRREKIQLLESGIVLSKTLTRHGNWTERIHVSKDRQKIIMNEARELCGE